MPRSPHRRTIAIFVAIAVYVSLQTAWWAYLLVHKDRELALAGGASGASEGRTIMMVVGEGSVFLLLVLVALYIAYRLTRTELDLARRQRNFLLAVTHELRTPVAAMKLQLQTLLRSDLPEGRKEQVLQQALDDGVRLEQLTEKLLASARLEEDQLLLRYETFDMVQLLEASAQRIREKDGNGHAITQRLPGELMLRSDPTAIRTVVDNLLENAVKYTPAGTPIRIELTEGDGMVELTVSDEGPGITLEHRDRVFMKFYRIRSEETRDTLGTGLGLFIVDRTIRALGGHVSYRPNSPTGSIFAATIPKA